MHTHQMAMSASLLLDAGLSQCKYSRAVLILKNVDLLQFTSTSSLLLVCSYDFVLSCSQNQDHPHT